MKTPIVEIGARIRKIRESNRWSQSDLSERIGKSTAYVSHIESGKQDIDTEVLFAIAAALSVAPGDLFTDNFIRSSLVEELDRHGLSRDYAKNYYPLVSKIRAGRGTVGEPKVEYHIEGYLPTAEGVSGYWFEVIGDSMFPKYEEGEAVLANPKLMPRDGGFAVVGWGIDECALKRIHYGPEALILASINPDYSPITIAKEEVWFIGRVVSVLSDARRYVVRKKKPTHESKE